jgi:hypothetical protein
MTATLPPITLPPPIVVHHSSGGLFIAHGDQFFTRVIVGEQNIVQVLNEILGQSPGGFEFQIIGPVLVPVAQPQTPQDNGSPRILRARQAPGGAEVEAPPPRFGLAYTVVAIMRGSAVPGNAVEVPQGPPELAIVETEGGPDAQA